MLLIPVVCHWARPHGLPQCLTAAWRGWHVSSSCLVVGPHGYTRATDPVRAALADAPAVEALGVTPAAGALEAAEPEAEAGRAKAVKMEEWDDQDTAEGGIELEAATDTGIADSFLRDEAADEDVKSIQIFFGQGIEGEWDLPWQELCQGEVLQSDAACCCSPKPRVCMVQAGSEAFEPGWKEWSV